MPPDLRPSDPNKNSLDAVMPAIYDELYKIASGFMRHERDSHTLQPTALVHEAYMRLMTQHRVDFSNRAQVLGVAAKMMRRILLAHEEKRQAEKRGGDYTRVTLSDSSEPVSEEQTILLIHVDEVLRRLSAVDGRQADIAELRIFGGLTTEESAEYLGVSTTTAHRDWVTARLWLTRELGRSNQRMSRSEI
ncbi:MAG: ECF-type sigma factor [Acidobacteriota bacterium]